MQKALKYPLEHAHVLASDGGPLFCLF